MENTGTTQMRLLLRLNLWGEKNQSMWMDILRIVTGMAIMAKAIYFFTDDSTIVKALNENLGLNFTGLSSLLIIVQLISGVLLIIGFATRFACLIQIPIVGGAMAFIYVQNQIPLITFIYTIAVLLSLAFFLIRGAGKLSLYYLVFI
jgi:putative oxidoreductase